MLAVTKIWAVACLAAAVSGSFANAALRVPAYTAYLEPDDRGAKVSARQGITGWNNPATRIVWFGQLAHGGNLEAAVELRVPENAELKLRLSVGAQSHVAIVRGAGTNVITASFGKFDVDRPGYHKFLLESLSTEQRPLGDIEALVLTGAATDDAHFNLKPRRNAASVHLNYPVAAGTNASAFYGEVTAITDPVHTFYMACGWHRGYFGMQVNSPTERRIIFSVWDSGNEGVDRGKVAESDRVKLVAKGENVNAGDFGNEGTGGHSHLKFNWKTGEPQRFLVTAQPTNQTFTIYSGYYFHPERKDWVLISAWRAPKEGGWLRRLHSFSENFVGNNGQLQRKALYGHQWIRTEGGEWLELTNARFSHDSTGRSDRLDRFMGVEDGNFFLSHGGFLDGFTKAGESFSRPSTARPSSINLFKP
jgi:hypothetical protein